MATFDSTVRLRQLNKPELSGYIVEVIGDVPNTGDLVNSFYPLKGNPNNYITTGQTGNFVTQEDLDSSYISTLIYMANTYYPSTNPNSYVPSTQPIVYATGNQKISGVKTFSNQTNFSNIVIPSVELSSGFIVAHDRYLDQDSFLFQEGNNLDIRGKNDVLIKFYEGLITGFSGISANQIYQSGVQVSTLNDLNSKTQNLVYTTGFQNIYGDKYFFDRVYFGIIDPEYVLCAISQENFRFEINNNYGLSFSFADFRLKHLNGFIDLSQGNITGFKNISGQNIYQNGVKVATVDDISSLTSFNIQEVVYKTGNQTINGLKDFTTKPTVNGVGVLLENQSVTAVVKDVVYTTGDQAISGIKSFYSRPKVGSGVLVTGILLSGEVSGLNLPGGGSGIYYNTTNNTLNFKTLKAGSGLRIVGDNNNLTFDVTGSFGTTISNLQNFVYTTGDQIISGNKSFNNGIYVSGFNFVKNYFPKIEITYFSAAPNAGTFYQGNASYQFTVYGVKTFEGKKYFSDPAVSDVLTVTNPNPPTYCLKLNWIKNSFYDEYFLAVNKDPKFSTPIDDSIENTNWGIYINKNVDLPIGIGETTGPGYVRDSSPTDFGSYQNLPQDYKTKYYSQIYGVTGNLVLKSAFLQLSGQTSFDQRPKVNGTGVLLQGEASASTLTGVNSLTPKNSNFIYTGNIVFEGLNGIIITTGQNNTISFSGQSAGLGAGGSINDAINLSDGVGLFKDKFPSDTLRFKSLTGVNGVKITENGDKLVFEATGNQNLENVVFTTGDQTINGKKVFSEVLSTNILKTNWIINSDSVTDQQVGTNSNFVGEGAGSTNPTSENSNWFSNFIGYHAAYYQIGINAYSNILGNQAGEYAITFQYANFIGNLAGAYSSYCTDSNFIGNAAGTSSTNCEISNFIGTEAGYGTLSCNYSNFIGYRVGYDSDYCFYSNFIGTEAGLSATESNQSNFIGKSAGYLATASPNCNFIGTEAGYNASQSQNSIFIGKQAGINNNLNNSENDFAILLGNYTSGKKNSIAIGQGASNNLEKQLNLGNIIYATNINTGIIPSSIPVSNGRVGILIDNPEYTLDVSGTCRITGETFFGVRPKVNGKGVLLEGEGGQGNGYTSSDNIITQKYGYGAGIYTFSKQISNSGNVFGIFDSKSGCQIFDVMINAEYPVAKKYSVVHQYGQKPISYLNVNSGPSGSNDFDVSFFASGLSGVAMGIKNNGNSSIFLATLFLGGSVNNVLVTGYP